jgi:hypothetical protein
VRYKRILRNITSGAITNTAKQVADIVLESGIKVLSKIFLKETKPNVEFDILSTVLKGSLSGTYL